MTFSIEQGDDLIIKKDGELFLTVKRKIGFRVYSQFYKNDELIFESSLLMIFLFKRIEIIYQNLPDKVAFLKGKKWLYYLKSSPNVLFVKIRYFKRPAFQLELNNEVFGHIGNPNLVSVGGRYYEMNTESDDENLNLYFLILFVSQLKGL